MHRATRRLGLVAALLMLGSAGWARGKHEGSADSFSSDVAWAWFDLLYDVVRSEGTPPPSASRIYGVTAVALYESIVSGAEENKSLAGQLNGLDELPEAGGNKRKYRWPTVANAALAQTVRGIFTSLKPQNLEAVNALEAAFKAQFEFEAEARKRDPDPSADHGRRIADAVLAWAATDGAASLSNCPYDPSPVPGAWEPTPPGFNPNPLQPCWGQIRPMVLSSGADCAPPGPPEFSAGSASHFYAAHAYPVVSADHYL